MTPQRVLLAVGLVLAGVSPAAAADPDAIPADFSLKAEYYPPLPHSDIPPARRAHPWTVRLTADGRAHQESNRTVPGRRKVLRRSTKVPRAEVAALVAEIRRANFHFLAPEYAFEVSPHAALVLRITMDGRSHDVTVYGPDRVKDDPEVAAFLRIWKRTVALVPPPRP